MIISSIDPGIPPRLLLQEAAETEQRFCGMAGYASLADHGADGAP